MTPLRRCRWLPAATLLWLPAQLPAYTVEPDLVILGPEGGDSSAFLRLANREARPTAIELVVNEFARDLDGRGVTGKPADDQFVIYPAQLVLMPGDEASVQLRWIGTSLQGTEQAFSITTREVTIPPTATAAREQAAAAPEGVRINVNVLVNYDVRVYVRPRSARPRVVVETTTVRPQAAPQPDLIEVTLMNQGMAHQSLQQLSLLLLALGPDGQPLPQSPVRLAAEEVPGMRTALLAGGRRLLLVPRPAALPDGPVRVQLAD